LKDIDGPAATQHESQQPGTIGEAEEELHSRSSQLSAEVVHTLEFAPTGRSVSEKLIAALRHDGRPGAVLRHIQVHKPGGARLGRIQAVLDDSVSGLQDEVGIVPCVNRETDRQLTQVAEATGALSFLLGPGQGRQQQRRQDGDDGYDNEQLDQSEAAPGSMMTGILG
jgi:hypothetical protein